jgi:hypothetical protein
MRDMNYTWDMKHRILFIYLHMRYVLHMIYETYDIIYIWDMKHRILFTHEIWITYDIWDIGYYLYMRYELHMIYET